MISSLKGILMLLPQGKAFDALKNRLECSNLLVGISAQVREEKKEGLEDEDVDKYVQIFMHENEDMFPKEYRNFLEQII